MREQRITWILVSAFILVNVALLFVFWNELFPSIKLPSPVIQKKLSQRLSDVLPYDVINGKTSQGNLFYQIRGTLAQDAYYQNTMLKSTVIVNGDNGSHPYTILFGGENVMINFGKAKGSFDTGITWGPMNIDEAKKLLVKNAPVEMRIIMDMKSRGSDTMKNFLDSFIRGQLPDTKNMVFMPNMVAVLE
jgi:hypothetical protein